MTNDGESTSYGFNVLSHQSNLLGSFTRNLPTLRLNKKQKRVLDWSEPNSFARFRNGDRYGGEYFGDKIHGFGAYHFANGHCYEGSWHEGRKQGYGMYTFRNGVNRSGEWDNGNLTTSLPPLTDPVLRAVQVKIKDSDFVAFTLGHGLDWMYVWLNSEWLDDQISSNFVRSINFFRG